MIAARVAVAGRILKQPRWVLQGALETRRRQEMAFL